jgi:hypothetical protein
MAYDVGREAADRPSRQASTEGDQSNYSTNSDGDEEDEEEEEEEEEVAEIGSSEHPFGYNLSANDEQVFAATMRRQMQSRRRVLPVPSSMASQPLLIRAVDAGDVFLMR